MSAKKISSKDLVKDVKEGLSDAELLEKYGISAATLGQFYEKLIGAGFLKRFELDQRKKVFRCPSCKREITEKSVECSHCGIIISKFKNSPPKIGHQEIVKLQKSSQSEPPKATAPKKSFESQVRYALSFVFGLLFLILGIFGLSAEFFLGLSFITIGIILFPPIFKKVESKLNYKFSSAAKFIICLALIFSFGYLNSIVNPPKKRATGA